MIVYCFVKRQHATLFSDSILFCSAIAYCFVQRQHATLFSDSILLCSAIAYCFVQRYHATLFNNRSTSFSDSVLLCSAIAYCFVQRYHATLSSTQRFKRLLPLGNYYIQVSIYNESCVISSTTYHQDNIVQHVPKLISNFIIVT